MPTQPPTPEQVRVFLAARRLRHHGWARFQAGTRRAALRQMRRMTEQDTTEHGPNTPA